MSPSQLQSSYENSLKHPFRRFTIDRTKNRLQRFQVSTGFRLKKEQAAAEEKKRRKEFQWEERVAKHVAYKEKFDVDAEEVGALFLMCRPQVVTLRPFFFWACEV